MREVGCRAYSRETGADIIECSGHRGKNRLQVLVPVKDRDQQNRGKEDDDIDSDIHDNGTYCLSLNRLSVHADSGDAARMNIVMDLLKTCFDQDDDTGDLDAAAGGTGAGSAEHDHDKQAPGVLRPDVKIRCGVAGGRNNGSHLESCMVESKKEIVKKAPDIDRDRDDSEGNDPQIPADLTDAESFLFILPQEKDKVCIKVDAEQDHENRDDGLLKNRIAGNTVAENAETSGTGGAEAQAETVKKRHARDEEQYDLCDGHTEVDHIEDHGGVADLGNKLSHDRARALRPHHMHLAAHSPLARGWHG